jgi:acyl-CoA thioesterase-1
VPSPARYVALGDSYTIGTATREPAERWPDQLVRALGSSPPRIQLVANLGVNGHTSQDVLERELPRVAGLRPDLISVLVGVNDVVQGVPIGTYLTNVDTMLDALVGLVPAGRIIAVSTPDYTVTPEGGTYGDPATQSAAIRRVNAVFCEAAARRSVAWVDVHDLSLRAATDRTLVADDGLHPSGPQYALWVERIAPVVAAILDTAAESAPAS